MELTKKQKAYVFGLQGIGPMIVDGALNGIIAWQITKEEDLSLWSMPMPLAGDLFVTTIIQSILTWLLVGIFVRNDIRINNITPIMIQSNDAECNQSQGIFIYLKNNMIQYPIFPLTKDLSIKIVFSTFLYTMLNIFLFAIPSLIILGIIQLADNDIDDKLDVNDIIIAKAVYGGVMGLFMTPIAAICTLIAYESKASSSAPTVSVEVKSEE